MFSIEKIIRPTVQALKPYYVWRDDYLNDKDVIFLDNCENNLGFPLSEGLERYPSSSQLNVKLAIANWKGLSANHLVLGNGSDELIDLLIRATCEPYKDNLLICEPTFGMFRVYAQLNAVDVINVALKENDFSWNVEEINAQRTSATKLIFICSPNNPTGTSFPIERLKEIAENFQGILVVDEAYIDFSEKSSALTLLYEIENLVVLQTFSKAWALAGLRLGVAYSSEAIISVLNKIRPPFNISSYTQTTIINALTLLPEKNKLVEEVLQQKTWLKQQLKQFTFVQHIVESDANFFLIKVKDANTLCEYLLNAKVLISNRSALLNCENHVRISIGTKQENLKLIELLNKFE
jgi:histidinol-phosphate aminotransferase